MAEGRSTAAAAGRDDLVAAYKRLLQGYLDRRPSGMRLKIAKAIGKHKSFVSQITNPAYPVPIPGRHLEAIFKICHFSADERESFLQLYHAAHPSRPAAARQRIERGAGDKVLRIGLPELKDPAVAREVEELIRQFARRVIALARKR